MHRSAVCVVSLVVLILTSAAWSATAQTVIVLPATGVNLDDATLQASQDVLRGHLTQTRRFQLVRSIPGEVGHAEIDPLAAMEAARSERADLAVALHMTRLGSAVQVHLQVYSAQNGAMVHGDRMVAATIDDVDRVLERLAIGFATGKSAADTAKITNVTQVEAAPARKKTATHVWGLSLGVLVPNESD